MAGLTIGKFAAAEGVGVETVRYYQRKGLLPMPERQRSGFREYSEADRWRLAFIRRARRLGFTLGEIRDLLGPAEARSTGEIVRAAGARLEAIDGQLAELMVQRCRLRRLVQVCEHGSGDDCAALYIAGAPAGNTTTEQETDHGRHQDRD
ncbi:MAG: MerR family transcriptional regulator [Streptosporangiaceae bacterium]|nr:MerR family transcriptional regulator [Streptosporangiaceae bacterium]MBV9857374.1 MerR family transcriptional regulator [Streptosporangiaceae bacterium]